MNITDILQNIDKLENNLKCPRCNRLCQDPVRIMTCGDYFCNNCLNKSSNKCPLCGQYFAAKNLDYNNLGRSLKIKTMLDKLKNVLQTDIDNAESKQESQENIIRIINYDCSTTYEYRVTFFNPSGKLNAKGESQLHTACRKNNIVGVQKLLDQRVDINAKDYAGWAPLHESVESKSLEITEILLRSGALINIPGQDYITPLHKAASNGDEAMVKLLLKYGADKDAVDYYGLKPIDSCNKIAVKEELLKACSERANVIYELFISNKIVAYCHSIDEEYKEKLIASKNIKVEQCMDPKRKITHFFIKRTHKLSFKILAAILTGLQIVTEDLVDNFLNGEYFIPVMQFTFVFNEDLNKGIRRAMINSLLKKPQLFDGINFFIEGHTTAISIYNLNVDKEFLIKLITLGNGRILHRAPALRTCDKHFHPYHAVQSPNLTRCCNYIIYNELEPPRLKYNMPELLHKSSKWLIDCIIKFSITD